MNKNYLTLSQKRKKKNNFVLTPVFQRDKVDDSLVETSKSQQM